MAGGYFSRLEYASNVSLPSSLVSEFAYIAREYVNNYHRSSADALAGGGNITPGLMGPNSSSSIHQQQQQQNYRQASVSAAGLTLGSSAMPAPGGNGGQSGSSSSNNNNNTKEEQSSMGDAPLSSQQQQQTTTFVHEMVAQQQADQQSSSSSSNLLPSTSASASAFTAPNANSNPMVTDEPSSTTSLLDMSNSSPGSVSMDGIHFPMGDVGVFLGGGMGASFNSGGGNGNGNGNGNDLLLGTDVMDLFNYSMPGIDPFAYADFRWP